ncbi:MAG TPA: HAMP domain-containing protein [Alphaproteobacteria bacterium]|nr:HAMP domain-containing protein [Alphaproteobacteria bacterium]
MAGQRVEQKWRPPLSWIVFAVLLAVLSLPVAIIVWFGMLNEATSGVEPVEIAALVVALVITLVIAGLFTRTITGPINALIRTTEAIGRGGSTPVPPPTQHGTRELAVLSQSFLDLAERLVERTDYVHSFAAHVSHELKSPLTAIRGSAELLLDDSMSAADRKRFARNIIADSDRLAVLLERLRALARTEVPLDAKGVTAARAAELLRERFPDLAIVAQGTIERPMALSEEAALIVLTHLADNAVQHGATELVVTAQAGEGTVQLRVADNGSGIAAGNGARIFEPFFTTRREQGGTGLGLEIARSMLQAHGGSIDLAPSERGAAFDIVVPLWTPARGG